MCTDTPYCAVERLLPHYCFRYGADAYEFWGVAWHTYDPFRFGWHSYIHQSDQPGKSYWIRYPNGDGFLIYPGPLVGHDGPVSTVRLEQAREGVEDYEYLYLLRQLVDRAKAAGGDTADAERAMKDAAALVWIPNAGGRYSTKMLPEPEKLYAAREAVAAAIERLSRPVGPKNNAPVAAEIAPAKEPPQATLDVAVDLWPKFKAWDLSTRVQGGRGTCSVFAMTAAIEFAAASKGHRGPPLSVEYLNWASNRASRTREDGSFFSDLWRGFVAHGICPEKDMPYQARFDPQARPGKEAREAAEKYRSLGLEFHWIKEWDPKKGLTDDQLSKVKQTLQRGWPVTGGFLWPKHPQWKEGVLQMCPRDDVIDGHSVLLVGYRDDAKHPGGGVFLIRNSSGPSREGQMSYEYLKAYMNDAAWVDAGGK
jgi:hypothetical protein